MLLKPLSILWFISLKSIVCRQISDCLIVFERQRKMFQIVTVSILDLNETEKVTFLVECPETRHWVEDAVCQSRRYCNLLNQPSSAFSKLFLFVKLAALCYCGPTEHVPTLLRAIALRDSTCSKSTLLNALRQDDIFLFVCLLYFHDFVMLLE